MSDLSPENLQKWKEIHRNTRRGTIVLIQCGCYGSYDGLRYWYGKEVTVSRYPVKDGPDSMYVDAGGRDIRLILDEALPVSKNPFLSKLRSLTRVEPETV